MNKSILGRRYQNIGPAHRYITKERIEARDRILNDIIPTAKYQQITCLCDFKDDLCLATIDRFGLPIRAVICKVCGLIRLSPRWPEEVYVRIYKEYFWPLQSGSLSLDQDRFKLSVRRAKDFADMISKVVDLRDKRILEIGCSYGAGLYKLKDLSRDLVGYDYDEYFLRKGRRYSGLDLRSGGLDQAIKDGDQYDVVILRHVLEHLFNPIDNLKAIKQLFDNDGVLFVEIPGVLGVDRWLPDPLMMFNAFHTFYFSLETLSQVMMKAGYTLIHGDEHVYSTWKVAKDATRHQVPSPNHAKRILTDIRKAERRRKFSSLVNNLEIKLSRLKRQFC